MYEDVEEREHPTEPFFPLVTVTNPSTTSSKSTLKAVIPRRRYKLSFKKDVIAEVERQSVDSTLTIAVNTVANQLGIPANTIEKWMRTPVKQKIEHFTHDKSYSKRRKTMFAPEGYYQALEIEAFEQVRIRHADGEVVTYLTLQQIARELNNEERYQYDCEFKYNWARKATKRNGMILCAPQNTHKESVDTAISKVRDFHLGLRRLLQTKFSDLVSFIIYIIYNLLLLKYMGKV